MNRWQQFAELSNSDGWFWETDRDHRFIWMSDSVEALTGRPPEWYRGKRGADIRQPGIDDSAWRKHLQQIRWHEAFEDFVFDPETGQPLAATLLDYALPLAADMPNFTTECHEVLTPMNPLGIRSAGEAGTTPALGCILNGVVDALKDLGVKDVEMPASAHNIWKAVQAAQQ